ncbi:MAG: replication factor C large subunit [Candidatus Bathyarchaeia archaeon]
MFAAWTVKHKPRTLGEVVGNKEAKEALVNWVKSWDAGVPKKRAVFVYGPPGVGKTVSVECLARDLGMELVEKNASDYRTEDAVRRFAGLASQYGSLFGGRRLILLDELDGIMGAEDRGGVAAITDIIKTAQCPVVLVANDVWDPRFATLRSYCLVVEFKRPPAGEVVRHLKRICEKEGIAAEEEALKFIATRSEGDVRSAVNDLQALAAGKARLAYSDVSWLAFRDRKEVIFSVLRLIFYAKSCDAARRAVDMADVDLDMLFQWVYENAPAHLKEPGDLVRGMEMLALADVYRGRLMRTQDWKLTRYVVDFMTAGVAMARQEGGSVGWVPFRFPERIKMLSRSRAERALEYEIGLRIKRRMHMSAGRAVKEVLPYLRVIFQSNPVWAAGLVRWFDFNEEMVEHIAQGKKYAKAIQKLLA